MKILVPIKQILDPGGITVRRDKERVFINREDHIIGPGSSAALEAALRIKDAQTMEVEVVAVSLGPARVDDALREALAMGCDAAYRLTDPAFEEVDQAAKARILAAGVHRLGSTELVIAGRESGDGESGQLGPRLAAALGYGQVTDVYTLETSEAVIQATRRWPTVSTPTGFARVSLPLPAVVTVAPEAFPARYPHGARIMNAYREWQVTVWDAADLGLEGVELEPLLVKRSERYPPPLETGEQYRGDAASLAWEVVTALRLQGLVEGGEDGL